ncbi:cell wall-binding repeat-containing protein [Paenibacillus validus]|uniref:cell wall-binding repeat-containing protein n=1 Tax=Paenibacillus validus TaxID=44253 RepID=UPI003D2CD109
MNKRLKINILFFAVILTLTACTPGATQGQQTQKGQVNVDQQKNKASEPPWIASKNTTRINNSDPFQTAVLVSKTVWMATNEKNQPGGVILANPEDWQSALVSADLIHHPNNGPVLFVNKNNVPEITKNELKRLNPVGSTLNNGTQVILVGNLDQNVEQEIKGMGFKIDWIKGEGPAAIAKTVDDYYARISQGYPQSVIIGSLDSQEYSLPAINWIAHMPEPLLYVTKDEIPTDTIEAIKLRNGKASIYLLGPKSIISENVEKQLGQYGKVVRISGNDPYENAVAFAKYKDPETGFGWGITSPGHNFSFISLNTASLALAAAPFSHLGKHAPILWTDKEKMPDTVMDYMMTVQPKYKKSPTEGPYNHSWLVGDEQSLNRAAQGEIDDMLEIISSTGEGHGQHEGNSKNGMSEMPAMGH